MLCEEPTKVFGLSTSLKRPNFDATNQMGDITTVVYFEGSRQPVFFGGNKFEFQPALSKLTKLANCFAKEDISGPRFEIFSCTAD